MGNEAEETVDNGTEVVEDAADKIAAQLADGLETEDAATEPELDDEGNPIVVEEAGEFEVIREGTQPQKNFDQQQVNDIVSSRVKKLNSKHNKK